MTIQDLIDYLSTLPPEAPVLAVTPINAPSDFEIGTDAQFDPETQTLEIYVS